MAVEKKPKLALVRGDCLNPWEANLWEGLKDSYDIVAICARKNLYDTSTISFPIIRLPSSTDSFVGHNFAKYVQGRFNVMNGLEKVLADFDIVHSVEVCYYYTYQALQAKKLNPKLKVVASVSDNSFGRFDYNYWPGFTVPPRYWRDKINHIVNTNITEVDAFVPITEYSAEFLRFYGADPKKIHVLMSGVDTRSAEPKATASHAFQKVQAATAGKQYLLMVNRLVKEKGVYDVLHAWKMYRHSGARTIDRLVIVGEGRERANMERLVGEWGLHDTVLFVGGLPNHEVRQLYAQASALVLASVPNFVWQEQFGYVLAEAIKNGCPIVSTFSGAIAEVVEDAGILVPPLNPVRLAEAFRQLENHSVRENLRAHAARVSTKFSVERYVSTLRQLYQSL